MKKSEFLQKLIEIEEESGKDTTIILNYINYLEEKKELIEVGDIELE